MFRLLCVCVCPLCADAPVTPQIVMCTLLGIMESLTAVQDMVATNTFDHACVSSLLVVVVVVVSLFLFLSVSFVSPSFPPPLSPPPLSFQQRRNVPTQDNASKRCRV